MTDPAPPIESRRRSSPLSTCLVLAFFLVLVGLPLLYYHCQSEIPKWMAAEALELYDSGDVAEAIPKLAEAVRLSEGDARMQLRLIRWMAEAGQAEQALALCEQQLAQVGRDPNLILLQSYCLQYLGRFADALGVYKSQRFPATADDSIRIGRLNNLAYYRALAGQEMLRAERDIQRAIGMVEESRYALGSNVFLNIETRTLIAMAIVAKHADRIGEVLPILNSSIRKLKDAEFVRRRQLTEAVDDFFSSGEDVKQKQLDAATRSRRAAYQKTLQSLAMLLATRAILFQDLGKPDRANADRIQIRDLGYDSDELALQLPNGIEADLMLTQSATYLDTRGFLRVRLGKLASARLDLDLAIQASEHRLLAIRSPISNSPYYSNGMIDLRAFERDLKHTCAVLYHHRILLEQAEVSLLEKQTGRQLAEMSPGSMEARELRTRLSREQSRFDRQIDAARKRIAALGHDPDGLLF